MSKRWNLKPQAESSVLAAYTGIHPSVAGLLLQRGVALEHAEQFLHPKYENQFDPFLFRDMRKATDRVWQAIDAGEKIVVYGDYDADAVTANAVLQHTFRYLGVEAGSYVPDRFTEGYGLNIEAFEKIKAGGAKVVVTVDCGTNSCDVADWCQQNGVDLIITDHHEITADVPKSFALINPKNQSDKYPDPQITGVGVAYKLAKALLSETLKVKEKLNHPFSVIPSESRISSEVLRGESASRGIPPLPQMHSVSRDDKTAMYHVYVEHWDKWLLDLVAIGTVADCHSLLGENRIFVKYGLMVLAKTRWPGLRALLLSALAGKTSALDTHTLGWLLAPRINAAGRLEHANIALDTLLAEDPITARDAAQALEKINIRRQDLTARLISEAREQAVLQQNYKILILASADWPKGIVGIAAGRLANEFGKPVIVLEKGEAECTGSARTYGDFNIIEALKAVSSHLTKFGGHKEAAGLTLATVNLENFTRDLVRYAESAIHKDAAEDAVLDLDAELTADSLNLDFFDLLEELAPFGAGNPKPKFWIKSATLVQSKKVGVESQHAQAVFDINGSQVQAIAFSQGRIVDTFQPSDKVDLAVELLGDEWNGIRKVKLRIIDIRRAVS